MLPHTSEVEGVRIVIISFQNIARNVQDKLLSYLFIGHTTTYRCYSEFKAGRMEVEDLLRSGRPTTM